MKRIIPYGTIVTVKEGFYRGYHGVIKDIIYHEDLETPVYYEVEMLDRRLHHMNPVQIEIDVVKKSGLFLRITHAIKEMKQ